MEYSPEQIEEAFKGINEIKEIIDISKKLPITLGGKFIQAKDNEWFEKNGTDPTDFYGEIGINQKTINNYERIYKSFVVKAGYSINELTGISYPKLLKLIPVLFPDAPKETIDEWINKAKLLSTTDFNIEFNQTFKDKKNPEDCTHENATKHAYLTCKECGEKIWIDPVTGEKKEHWHNK
jgi:hypothetical protein